MNAATGQQRGINGTFASALFPLLIGAPLLYLALSCLVWVGGEVGGRLGQGRWPNSSPSADAGAVLARLIQDPANPAHAWPSAGPSAILPAPYFYLITVPVAVLGLAMPAAAGLVIHNWGPDGVLRRRWAHTNPNRLGFARGSELRSPRTPARQLRSWRPSYDIWLGFERDALGRLRPLRGSGDRQSSCAVGVPGEGKTRGLILYGLLLWPGSVVTTSTKTEVVLLAGAARDDFARRRGGEIHLLDWSDLVGPELAMSSISWDPLDGCRDTRVVSHRVAALLGAVQAPHGNGVDDGFWRQGAAVILHAYLHAAALEGLGIGQVLEWLDRQETDDPVRIIEAGNRAAAVWGYRLQGLANSPSQITIGGFFETAKACFAALQEPVVLSHCSHSDFDVERFLARGSTLFVVDPAGESKVSPTAPLTAALIDWIADRAYRRARRSPNLVCEPALGMFLDELPNIAPLASLPRHLSQGGSQGVHVACWTSQTYAQLEALYGEREARNIWALTRYAVLFGGSKETDWLEGISKLSGEYEDREISVSRSRREHAVETTISEHPVRRPILPLETLPRIPHGEALLLSRGRAVRVFTPPLHVEAGGPLRAFAERLGPPPALEGELVLDDAEGGGERP